MKLSEVVRMKRSNAVLTPEEARLYEKYSISEVQQAARHRPINTTDDVKKAV